MWVSVFELKKLSSPHLPSMWLSVFYSIMLTPPHLTSMWVSGILDNDYKTTTINLNVGKCVLVEEVDTTPNRKILKSRHLLYI